MKDPSSSEDPAEASLGARACLRRAEQRRQDVGAPYDPLDAFRCINGLGDGAPAGLVIDRYRNYVVISARPEVASDVVDDWVATCVERWSPTAVVVKTVVRKAGSASSRVVYGRVDDDPLLIREADATFECRLDDGLQTGLFLDHRDTRLLSRQWATGVEVLNLFAYTCAFSVHAALAGAVRVTSVDSSKRALRWGRANMTASGLSPDAHRWFNDDVVTHLRRGPAGQYGLVILDPPVMGRALGKTFSLMQQVGTLLSGAVRKLAPSGVLVFSTHARALTTDMLRSEVEATARSAGRRVSWLHELGLPAWDHPIGDEANGLDRGDYLKTLVMQFA